jgi:hypothetical protein
MLDDARHDVLRRALLPFTLAAGAIASSGCVPIVAGVEYAKATYRYEKPGVDEARTQQDLDLCMKAAKVPREPRDIVLSGGSVTSYPYEGMDPEALDRCMTAKGYTRLNP